LILCIRTENRWDAYFDCHSRIIAKKRREL
jgi:hypothetical protein